MLELGSAAAKLKRMQLLALMNVPIIGFRIPLIEVDWAWTRLNSQSTANAGELGNDFLEELQSFAGQYVRNGA